MHSILLVVVGAIVGGLARFIGPGKAPGPLVASMLLGVAGALAGQFLGRLTGFSHADESADFLTAIVGAVLLVVLYRRWFSFMGSTTRISRGSASLRL